MPETELVVKVRADVSEARAQIATLRTALRVVPLGDCYVLAATTFLAGLLFGVMA